MKTVFTVVFALMLFAVVISSCSKSAMVKPNQATSTTSTASSTDISTLTSMPVFFMSQNQVVTTSVTNTTLNLIYTEKVNLLADYTLYYNSWYVYFYEDFSKTNLAGLSYTTLLSWGVTSTNYIPDGVNQMTKTVIDTLINNTHVIKINFTRSFNFTKIYARFYAAAQNNA